MSYVPPLKLIASYSEADNSYATSASQQKVNNINIDLSAGNNNELISNNKSANAKHCVQQQPNLDEATRRSTLTETLLEPFIKDGRPNCLPVYLLGATLVTSILNTLLLSFVVKSFQLNDSGFMDGQITWNEQIQSTVFEPPTRLARQSIRTNFIESINDKALVLEQLDRHKGIDGIAALSHELPAFMESLRPTGTVSTMDTPRTLAAVIEGGLDGANYITTTASSGSNERTNEGEILEIGTKLLTLNLISSEAARTVSTDLWFEGNQSVLGVTSNASNSAASGGDAATTLKRLLEFDGIQHSFTLPLERQLRLNPQKSASLVVHERLKSPELIGSVEENLDLQTRDGNLDCKCEKTMKLMSRSADARVTSFEELTLKTPSVILSSRHLYIPKGMHYFENSKLEGNSAGSASTEAKPGRKLSFSSRRNSVTTSDLRAYNLVAINGLLMATA